MLLRAFILAAAFLSSGAFLQAGTRDPAVPDSKYVDFGKEFPFVLKIKALEKLGDNAVGTIGAHCGSAVAIGSNWVLTAGHIFPEDNICGGYISFADKEREPLPLDIIVVHGGYPKSGVGWHDIAICHTPADIGLDFYPEIYTDFDEKNKVCTMSGFGATGTFTSGYGRSGDGLRRAGSNTISGVDKSVLICEPSRKGKTSLEFLICPGDSGGGLFIGNKLAGIVSYISGPPGGKKPRAVYGDTASFTRLSLYAGWVKAHMELVETALSMGETPDNPNILKVEP